MMPIKSAGDERMRGVQVNPKNMVIERSYIKKIQKYIKNGGSAW